MVLFGLGRLFYVILLLINAVAVLSEERFLRRSIGLGRSNDETPVFGQDQNTTKSKVVQLIGAVQTLLRSIPLIGINILVIVYELLLG
ncbi:Yos1p [Saccharomyces cerevisiae JAY291]|uniref:Yos1p n=1 Tax=Saccharomyces cerevisiae (strain JAY291) TaxID=574961 RepID=C7GRQ6_YEAS2|nr:Yos1p [Saccharomyces cerevisiae JAY291]